MKNEGFVHCKVGEIMDENTDEISKKEMDKTDIIGIFGFANFAIGTFLINPAIMFLSCGVLCMGLAFVSARKGVNDK
jgi:hypothetical protein